MIINHNTATALVCAILFACSNTSAGTIASTWFEQGDAGDSLATANVIGEVFPLNHIAGTLPDNDPNGVDLYQLFIPDPSKFSASTDNFPSTDLLDTWLYLFDENGMGIAASASSVGGSFHASISEGSVLAPPGQYYLAVTRLDSAPQSATGPIFPDLVFASTNGEVVGPTGTGGNNPLASWTSLQFLDFENYQIDLTGAASAVPEPSAAMIWACGSLLFVSSRKRKR